MRAADQMMFLDCPAYLDGERTVRCGLPAEVRCRFTMDSSDGPLEAAMIRCPSGHWFDGPIEFLTWESEEKRHPGEAAVASSATYHVREGLDDGGLGRPTANSLTARAGIIAHVTSLTAGPGLSSGITPESHGRKVRAPTPLLPTIWGGLPACG
jgi:hypothetical protein